MLKREREEMSVSDLHVQLIGRGRAAAVMPLLPLQMVGFSAPQRSWANLSTCIYTRSKCYGVLGCTVETREFAL